MKKVDRRKFLKDLQLLGVGCVAGSLAGPIISSCGGGGGSAESETSNAASTPSNVGSRILFPWPYKELDPNEAADHAYIASYSYLKIGNGKAHGCGYGAFEGVIGTLRKVVGSPYDQIPTGMLYFGRAGVLNWATICGALNGACPAIQVISPSPEKLIMELMFWYSSTPLPIYKPSDKVIDTVVSNFESIGKGGKVEEYKGAIDNLEKGFNTSISNSPICHISVAKWLEANSYDDGGFQTPKWGAHSAEREERCARLIADVVYKTVDLLNAQIVHNNFKPSYKNSAEVSSCLSCHGMPQGTDPEHPTAYKRDDTRMLEGNTCINCHTDIGKDPNHPFK